MRSESRVSVAGYGVRAESLTSAPGYGVRPEAGVSWERWPSPDERWGPTRAPVLSVRPEPGVSRSDRDGGPAA
ncbi:hypothetical protein, partial [Streptomyces sp. SID2119]|uniref:hypothetical protein n=1 Tax=Streptomyces sp. SID2119 TaxID=2690253 RepID=UPI001F2A422A